MPSLVFAIRVRAYSSMATGIVLIGAVAAPRYHRIRESVLLRTMGPRWRLTSQVTITEYSAPGFLAGLTGVVLGSVAGKGATR